ncbi:hypothetical protein TNCV_368691 [Trichonephila clavipes]|nr:hypothetical protein TNCV_368691 [Trichonephila clavipes]
MRARAADRTRPKISWRAFQYPDEQFLTFCWGLGPQEVLRRPCSRESKRIWKSTTREKVRWSVLGVL